MYTIKILQRLIDRGTHNSIFAFVLLILKNHFQRASLLAENRSTIPSPFKSPGPAPRLPPPTFSPAPSCDTADPPIRKENFQKPDYQRTRRPNCGGRTF